MKKFDWESPLGKAIKEVGRVVVLAVLPILIANLESGVFDWRLIAVTAGLALLKAIDKFFHEIGKNEGDEVLIKGLTRF